MMALQNKTKITVGILFAFVFSALFILSSPGVMRTSTFVIHILLGLQTTFGLALSVVWWKQGTREKKAAALLLWVLLIDYWVWILLARYDFPSSYIFLAVLEAHRLVCVIQLIRSAYGPTSIDTVWNVYLLRLPLVDIPVIVLGHSKYGWTPILWWRLQFMHPLLLSGPSFSVFFFGYVLFELNCTALYVSRFRATPPKISKTP